MMTDSKQYGNDCFAILTETGLRHQQCNVTNQDAVLFSYEDGDYLLAVADGVGSCQHAVVGAQSAVKAAKAFFLDLRSKNLNASSNDLSDVLLRYWRVLISGYIENECCTTLKCAVKIKEVLYLFSIGDGFIAFSSDEAQIVSPTEIHDFGNETACLNSSTHASDFWLKRINLWNDLSYTVFACTDGIANGLNEGDEINLVRSIDKEIPSNQLLNELTGLLQDISLVSSDDKTMGVIKHDKRNEEPVRHSRNHR